MTRTGEMQLSGPDVYDDGCLRIEYDKFYVTCDGKPLYTLTVKEFRILSRLVREIGRPIPPPVIWASVWGKGSKYDSNAARLLRVHISTLRRKLEPFGLHIFSKPNMGYVFSDGDCVCPTTNPRDSAAH